jgi:hypothetical protein
MIKVNKDYVRASVMDPLYATESLNGFPSPRHARLTDDGGQFSLYGQVSMDTLAASGVEEEGGGIMAFLMAK